MPLPDIDGFVNDPQRYVAEQFQREAENMAVRAASFGLVLTIEQSNGLPPRMGNYCPVVSVRPDIFSIRKAYAKAMAEPVPMLMQSADCAGVAFSLESGRAPGAAPLSEQTKTRIAAGVAKFCLPGAEA